jgi:hypothetical protein
MRGFLLTGVVFGCVALTFAAPTLKEKDEPPPTKEQAKKTVNNLRHIGLGFHNYHDVFNCLPQNVMKDGKPILSWRVHLLPYMEEEELWKSFKLDEPWDGPNNKKLIAKIPDIYKPVRGKAAEGETFYQMLTWDRGLLRPKGDKVPFAAITDGLSNTFFAVEAYTPVIWTKPDDIPYNPKELPKLGRSFDGDIHVLMGDGAARKMKKTIDAETLRRMIVPNDGQVVDVNKFDGLQDMPEQPKPNLAVPPLPK